MALRLRLSKEAQRDIRAIRYNEYYPEEARARYVAELRALLLKLRDYPDLGRQVDGLLEGCRCLVFRYHLIFYQHECGVVSILRVLDGRRDYLKELLP